MTYDNNNIFAKILRQELPCHKVYEDDKTLAFMDIMPSAKGHVLIIPKYSACELSDLPLDYAQAVLATAQKIIKAQRQILNITGVAQMQFNGESAGQSVFHYHLHLIPAHYQVVCCQPTQKTNDEELATLAKRLSDAIQK